MIEKPKQGEYNPFYDTYISKVSESNVLTQLQSQAHELPGWFESLAEKADYRYEEDKWTIAEVLHHCLDAERIFA